MSGKKSKQKSGKGRKHTSIRQLRGQASKNIKPVSSDPIGELTDEWFNNARSAEKWKEKWECMQELMEGACGDPWGKCDLPEQFDSNKKALEVLNLFSKWLSDENHIFVRQHILKLLVPFSKSYDKSCWKKANSIAEGIMLKQWMEKKHGFLPLVTPALLAVYNVNNSSISLKKWKESLIECMQSAQGQVRMSVWDFLSKVCATATTIKKKSINKDIQSILNDRVLEYMTEAIVNDKEKEVRDSCAKFVIGAKQLCPKFSALSKAISQIVVDKRAQNTLDAAKILFEIDVRVITGGKAPAQEDVQLLVEKKQKKEAKKAKNSRKSAMRAMIAAAKKKAEEEGVAGGEIEIAQTNTNANSNSKAKSSTKKNSKNSKKKKKSPPPKKPQISSSDDSEDKDDSDNDSNSDNSDSDSEERRRKAEEEKRLSGKARKEQERRDRERKRKDERERRKKEKTDRKERERKERKEKKEREALVAKQKQAKEEAAAAAALAANDNDSDSSQHSEYDEDDDKDDDEDDESEDPEDALYTRKGSGSKGNKASRNHNGKNHKSKPKPKNKKKSSRIRESHTDTIEENNSSSVVDSALVTQLTDKVDDMNRVVHQIQSDIKGMDRKLTEVSHTSNSNSQKGNMSSRTEEKIMKILSQLQKDVKIMKNDLAYIKACWEDAESVPSDDN